MLAAALILAFLFDTVVVLAARGLVRRSADRSADGSSSIAAQSIAFGGAGIAIVASAIVASLATSTVQAEIIMTGMARYEPFRTIIATDPHERTRIRQAVDDALRRDGSIRDKVRGAVEAEVGPYLRDRVAHAPDALVVEMGRMTLRSLVEARRIGQKECLSVMSGDEAASLRSDDQAARQALLARIVAAPYQDNPERATPADVASAETVQAPAGTSPCDLTIMATTGMLRLPTGQAARLLRVTTGR